MLATKDFEYKSSSISEIKWFFYTHTYIDAFFLSSFEIFFECTCVGKKRNTLAVGTRDPSKRDMTEDRQGGPGRSQGCKETERHASIVGSSFFIERTKVSAACFGFSFESFYQTADSSQQSRPFLTARKVRRAVDIPKTFHQQLANPSGPAALPADYDESS